MVIKEQALVDFIVEFAYTNATEVTGMANSAEAMKAQGYGKERNLYLQKGTLNSRPHM